MFTLDTSGAVPMGRGENAGLAGVNLRWSDLSPFVQGYVEAMFSEHGQRLSGFSYGNPEPGEGVAFRDLAPEALALILRDCERYQAREAKNVENVRAYSGETMAAKVAAASRTGAQFWQHRNVGTRWFSKGAGFPPLTPYLGDDGKVHLKEAA